MSRLIYLVITLLVTAVATAEEGVISKRSGYGVAETLDRLEAVLESKGVMVFSRIDHSAGARAAGLDLPPTQLLIFGNPKLGTPLMQSRRTSALDLPLKVIAWQDGDGSVWLSYNDPAWLKRRHAIDDRAAVFARMAEILDTLTDKALAATPLNPEPHH